MFLMSVKKHFEHIKESRTSLLTIWHIRKDGPERGILAEPDAER